MDFEALTLKKWLNERRLGLWRRQVMWPWCSWFLILPASWTHLSRMMKRVYLWMEMILAVCPEIFKLCYCELDPITEALTARYYLPNLAGPNLHNDKSLMVNREKFGKNSWLVLVDVHVLWTYSCCSSPITFGCLQSWKKRVQILYLNESGNRETLFKEKTLIVLKENKIKPFIILNLILVVHTCKSLFLLQITK